MGEFDFGQFKEIYDYINSKLNAGDTLTPQEKQVYDMLLNFANQGLNLTQTGDFNSLYTAFNALADEGTKREFEKLYGTGLTQDADGKISFTRPGSVIEQFQRRGLSVNDGPVMAALSEGLRDFNDTLARNKFAAMTNSYQAMTPIRGQNLQATQGAGQVAGGAAQRRVGAASVAGGGGRRGTPEDPNADKPIEIPVPPRPDQPSILERLAPDLIKLFGAGALGVGGRVLDKWMREDPNDPNKNKVVGTSFEENERPPGYQGKYPDQEDNPYDLSGNQQPGGDQSPYDINMQSFTGKVPQASPLTNPYGSPMDMSNMAGGGYAQNNVWQQDYSNPPPTAQAYGNPSWQQNYDYNTFQPQTDYGGWQQSYDWAQPEQTYPTSGGWDQGYSYDPGPTSDWYMPQYNEPAYDPSYDWGGWDVAPAPYDNSYYDPGGGWY